MKSQNINYNPLLDDTRAIACILVFIDHFTKIIKSNLYLHFPLGNVGVTLFFVLSGYLFTLISYKKEMNYKNFILNRCLRILPLYTFVMFIGFSEIIATLTGSDLLYYFLPNGFRFWYMNGMSVVWSIGVEFLFYVIFPFIIVSLNAKGIKYLIGLIGLTLILNLCLLPHNNFHISYYTIFFRLPQFLIGMLAGVIAKNYGTKLYFRFSYLIAFACLIIMIAFPLKGFRSTSGYMEQLVLALLAAVFILFNNKRLYLNKLGKISFSFYLLHYIVIMGTLKRFPSYTFSYTHIILVGIFAFVFTLFVATLSYNLIEKPFLEKRRKYIVNN